MCIDRKSDNKEKMYQSAGDVQKYTREREREREREIVEEPVRKRMKVKART